MIGFKSLFIHKYSAKDALLGNILSSKKSFFWRGGGGGG